MELWNQRDIVIKGKGMTGQPTEDLYAIRQNVISSAAVDDAEVTIIVTSHNRVDKLRNCISSIFRCTKDVNFHLLIADSSTDQDTLDYLNTIDHPQTRIVHIDGPSSYVGYKTYMALPMVHTPYFIRLTNDIIVTEKWLSILLRCVKEDPEVGMACPMLTNVSNFQQVNFEIADMNELAVRAKMFNKSDPRKWRQRLRLMDGVALSPTGLLSTLGAYDIGFLHDFSDDDISYRIRAAGYKLMLCGDVFVHHDHDFRNMEDKDPEKFKESLRIGRAQFQSKHHGLDAWDDVNNYEPELLALFHVPQAAQSPSVLGVDCRMGTPILELKNKYRAAGAFDAQCHAFTTKAKYFADLQTICGDSVICDREAYFSTHYEKESFDTVILGSTLNSYENPYKLLDSLYGLLKKGGQLLLKLGNTQSIITFCRIIGQPVNAITGSLVELDIDDLAKKIESLGAVDVRLAKTKYDVDANSTASLRSVISVFHPGNSAKVGEQMERIMTAEYCICIEK